MTGLCTFVLRFYALVNNVLIMLWCCLDLRVGTYVLLQRCLTAISLWFDTTTGHMETPVCPVLDLLSDTENQEKQQLLSFWHHSGRRFFAWPVILNENILFWFTVSYQIPYVFSVSVFCSQIRTLKLNLQPKIGLTYAISIVKQFSGLFCPSKYFLLSFAALNY